MNYRVCCSVSEPTFVSPTGFIEFIVEPSMGVCADMLEVVLAPILGNSAKDTNKNKDAIEEEPAGECVDRHLHLERIEWDIATNLILFCS